jgi:hypothetical protein
MADAHRHGRDCQAINPEQAMTRRQTDPLNQAETTKLTDALKTSEQERGMTDLIALVLNAIEAHGGRLGSVQQIVAATRQTLGITPPVIETPNKESNDATTAQAGSVHDQVGPANRSDVRAEADVSDDAGRTAPANSPAPKPDSLG